VEQKPHLSWAAISGLEHDAESVVPAASTIKIFIASAFWRSSLDPREPVAVEPTPWSLSDQLDAALTLGDLAFLMLAVSDNAATNAILGRLGFDAVNEEIARVGLGSTVVRRKISPTGRRTSRARAILRSGSPRSPRRSRGSSKASREHRIRSSRASCPMPQLPSRLATFRTRITRSRTSAGRPAASRSPSARAQPLVLTASPAPLRGWSFTRKGERWS
jgi:hypothetical protein